MELKELKYCVKLTLSFELIILGRPKSQKQIRIFILRVTFVYDYYYLTD